MNRIFYTSVDSPIGTIFAASTIKGVCAVSLAVSEKAFIHEIGKHGIPESNEGMLCELRKDIQDYFKGKRIDFNGYSLDISSGTAFQRRVWNGLRGIPYGETRSYRWLAEEVGSPNGCRAVGGANGKNPIPIIIPCHRVINSDKSLGGYSGGVWIKEWLLRLEKAI